jgi:methylglyoxal synthase
MEQRKRIALVAHDNRKKDLMEWVEHNATILLEHQIICTGTTGTLVENLLRRACTKLGGDEEKVNVIRLKSGPLGGDQQLGAMISEGGIDIMIFFWDPMEPQPHDVDVKALLRITVLYNIPTCCNRSTADFLITSPIFSQAYTPKVKDYSNYINRKLNV